ncbi:MAG: S-layer homology domain-containing protein [Firmicutes bacterium]|nr:S-layer homology domain-containing protein [Bacillota bacterium]
MRRYAWRAGLGALAAALALSAALPAAGARLAAPDAAPPAGAAPLRAGVGFDLAADPPPQVAPSFHGASGSTPPAPSPSDDSGWPFRDLAPDAPGAEAVLDLYRRGIVRGTGEGRFEPERPVTRAEFAKLVLNSLGIRPGPGFPEPFDDVRDDAWCAPYVSAAWRLGIVRGDGDGRFRPDDPLTVEEMAVIAWRARNENAGGARPAGLADAAEVDDWAAPAVAAAWKRGLLQPDSGGRLHPRAAATRLEAAVFAQRLAADAAAAGIAREATVDGQTFPYVKSWTMRTTAYSDAEPGVGGRTATGLAVREGIVAVDPKVIPLGSYVYVEGYGFALAADTGGSIKGERIDVYMDAPARVVQRFGVRTRKVYLIAPPR